MSNVDDQSPQPLLEVKNLHAGVEGKQILHGIDLTVMPGEVHAIMGPNGSGKSTLTKVLAGHEGFEVTGGEVRYQGRNLLDLAPEERAREGVFLAFQYPVEIPGVSNATSSAPPSTPSASIAARRNSTPWTSWCSSASG